MVEQFYEYSGMGMGVLVVITVGVIIWYCVIEPRLNRKG